MKFEWLKARQTKYTAYATIYIAVILAVLGGANFLANRYNKSYDSTANKKFSLSDQTDKVVRGLKRDVKVYYFDRTSEFGRARDLLDRYDNLSTKLQIEYVDPYKKPQLAKAMAVRTEGTIFVEAGAKREEAKSLSEEEVTGALIRALKTGDRMACVVVGLRRAFARRHQPLGLLADEGDSREEQLQDPDGLASRKAGSAEGLHGAHRRRPD